MLTCAAPDCGCKITYAPQEKNGKTYRYYRCAGVGAFIAGKASVR